MGLDAVVYKHRTKFPVDPEHAGLQMEATTGEWYSETDDIPEPIRSSGVEALHMRLGNVTLIAALASEVCALLPADSVLLRNVLYEGGHAGDVVPLNRIGTLKEEIATLQDGVRTASPALVCFLKDLEELVAVAQENHSPIVFV